jgi:hypothetical protein
MTIWLGKTSSSEMVITSNAPLGEGDDHAGFLILGFSPPHPPLVVDSTSHSCNSLSSLELTLVIGFSVSSF